jgi:hypothetical protein
MAKSLKMFVFKSKLELEDIASRIRRISEDTIETKGATRYQLKSCFENVRQHDGRLYAIFSKDSLMPIESREEITWIKKTDRSEICYFNNNRKTYMFISPTRFADNTATFFGKRMFANTQNDVSSTIVSNSAFHSIYQTNHNGTPDLNYAGWDGLNIPQLNKSALRGKNLSETNDFSHYDSHGILTYIGYRNAEGIYVQVYRDGRLLVFKDIDDPELIDLIEDEIVPHL